MRVVLVNGGRQEERAAEAALKECDFVFSRHGIETERYVIGTGPVQGCISCGKCGKKNRCVFEDGVNEAAEMILKADGLIFACPVYYGEPEDGCLAFFDRLFRSAALCFAGKPAAAVVLSRKGGAAGATARVYRYFEGSCMPVVTGREPCEIRGLCEEDVNADAPGRQNLRMVAENMAWLLKCIEEGRRNGVPNPEYEPDQRPKNLR